MDGGAMNGKYFIEELIKDLYLLLLITSAFEVVERSTKHSFIELDYSHSAILLHDLIQSLGFNF